jgi:hypothetical protein
MPVRQLGLAPELVALLNPTYIAVRPRLSRDARSARRGSSLAADAARVLALGHGGALVGFLGGGAAQTTGGGVVLAAVEGVEVAVHGALAELLVLVVA